MEAEGADGYLGGVKESGAVDVEDVFSDQALRDAGDEVADVVITGEGREAVAVGFFSGLFAVELAEVAGAGFLDGEGPGLSTALNGGVRSV